MKKTTAPTTPSPHKTVVNGTAGIEISKNYRKDFLVVAMNMSWQLAIVVLVPIIGGFKLDTTFGSTPALTIVGFFIAMGGMGLVVWRQLQIFTPGTPAASRSARGNSKGTRS